MDTLDKKVMLFIQFYQQQHWRPKREICNKKWGFAKKVVIKSQRQSLCVCGSNFYGSDITFSFDTNTSCAQAHVCTSDQLLQ